MVALSSSAAEYIPVAENVSQALDLTVSDGAASLIYAAARLANLRGTLVGPRELIVAALALGVRHPSSKINSAAADTWLYDWLADQRRPDQIDKFVGHEALNAFPLPLPPLFGRHPSEPRARAAELSRESSAILWRASLIASQTEGYTKFGVRHIVSSLILPDEAGANRAALNLLMEALEIDLQKASEFILHRATQDTTTQAVEAWHSLFAAPPSTLGWETIAKTDEPYVESEKDKVKEVEPKPAPTTTTASTTTTAASPTATTTAASPTTPIPTRGITSSGFNSDNPASRTTDPLGIGADVLALARLVCLEQAAPLSICIFGEWGSGKSTFMDRLQEEITILAGDSSKPDVAAGGPRLVSNIAHIKFNAWHFADANLWASLTAVFFEQLRRAGDGPNADYNDLVSKVTIEVRSLEAKTAKARDDVDSAKKAATDAQDALAEAKRRLAASERAIALPYIKEQLEDIRRNNESKLEEVGRLLNRDNLSSNIQTFNDTVIEAASLTGKIGLILRVLVKGSWTIRLSLLAVVLLGIAVVVLPSISMPDFAALATRVSAWAAAAVAATAALRQAWKPLQPILEGASKLAKEVNENRTKLAKEATEKEKTVKQTKGELEKAENDLKNVQTSVSKYLADPVDSPSSILRYFLFEDSDLREYNKQVGIVSRARRSFEQLNSIVMSELAKRKEAEKDKEAQAKSKNDFPVPGRIVLYIDDLDRCNYDQVYAVLQAIHLLLSFKAFVVVVGVDLRWIENAIAKQFESELISAEKDDDALDRARRKRAVEYLEKIFQIPFWLKRLDTVSSDKSGESTYSKYVEELLSENVRKKADTVKEDGPPPAAPPPAAVPPVATQPSQGVGAGQAAQPARTTGTAPPQAAQKAASSEALSRQAAEEALVSLTLDDDEAKLLASTEIGNIARKSPRTVKRFINVYRIVRARLLGDQLRDFLGQSGKPPGYPLAALLVALEAGQPVELAEEFYPALRGLPSDALLADLWEQKGGALSEGLTKFLAKPGGASVRDDLKRGLRKVDQLRGGGKGATVAAYLEMADLIRRYSFNRFS